MENEFAEDVQNLLAVVNLDDLENIDVSEALRLHDEDVNNHAEIDVESGDSDLEEDHEDDNASGRIVLKKDINFSDQIFCVTQNYILLKLVNNKKETLCFYCFYVHQYFRNGGAYYHTNTHVKRKIVQPNEDIKCVMCSRSLIQITIPDVCLYCNADLKCSELDWDTNLPIIPH